VALPDVFIPRRAPLESSSWAALDRPSKKEFAIGIANDQAHPFEQATKSTLENGLSEVVVLESRYNGLGRDRCRQIPQFST
jgi:hypothetical protein